MARNKKRSQRQLSPQPIRQDIKHDWKKDDEELELEEALFGRKQKKFKPDNKNDEESGMSEVEDNDVRLCSYAIITSKCKSTDANHSCLLLTHPSHKDSKSTSMVMVTNMPVVMAIATLILKIQGTKTSLEHSHLPQVVVAPCPLALTLNPSPDLNQKKRLTAQQSLFPTISSTSRLLMMKNYHVQKEYHFGMTLRMRWQRLISVHREG